MGRVRQVHGGDRNRWVNANELSVYSGMDDYQYVTSILTGPVRLITT